MSKHNSSTTHLNEEGLILSGYQKKLKTMKKKFFVLYKDTLRNAARLEYYDNDRKFKAGLSAKRVIKLKNCFNINRRLDTKHDFVIALSTKDGAFGIVFETKDAMQDWLENLISLQRCDTAMSDTLRPHFEHVWQVLVQRKGLAENKGIVGTYHVCLTAKSLTFIRIGPEKMSGDMRTANIEFLLTTIRRCGDSQCFFYMEVGRQSVIGPGELWMETEDSLTAQNMHRMILCAMSEKSELNAEPMRKRSSSANEASKPINVIQRRQAQAESKGNVSPQASLCYGRERCDSLPSRNRTSSECSNQSFNMSSALSMRSSAAAAAVHRSQSYQQRHSNSPPISTTTMGCSESEESSISIDEADDNGGGGPYIPYRFNSRTSGCVIPEENTDELVSCENKSADNLNQLDGEAPEESYMSMAPVKNHHKDLEERSNTLNKQLTKARDDISLSSVPLSAIGNTMNATTQNSILEFPEYSSDNVTKLFTNELNSQTELPTRTYSIGSKFEHSKLSKRYANLNDGEHNNAGSTTVRVRAFSVGSRIKIPRCDLQRGALFPKAVISEQQQQSYNSNNNLFNSSGGGGETATGAYNALLNIGDAGGGRDKKSTSAPLLIHKSQNSVDHMSDLMEIDFSMKTAAAATTTTTTTTATTTTATKANNLNQNRSYQPAKVQFNAKNAATVAATSEQSNRKADGAGRSSPPTLPLPHDATTDNGYLEMKPVGSYTPKQHGSANVNKNNSSSSNSLQQPLLTASEHAAAYNIPKTIAAVADVRTKTTVARPPPPPPYETLAAPIGDIQNIAEAPHGQPMAAAAIVAAVAPIVEQHAPVHQNNSLKFPSLMSQLSLDGSQSDAPESATTNSNNCSEQQQQHKKKTNHCRKAEEITPKCVRPTSISLSQRRLHGSDKTTTMATTTTPAPNITSGCGGAGSLEKIGSKQQQQQFNDSTTSTSTTTATNINVNANMLGDKKSYLDKEACAGYEILQIKSDSSLLPAISKHYNRPSSIRKEKSQQQQQQQLLQSQQAKPNKAGILSAVAADGQLAASTAAVGLTNRLNAPTGTPNLLLQLNVAVTTVTTAAAVAAAATALSRPPSVSSEQGLYYASLDLPQCSGELMATKMCKAIESAIEAAPAVVAAAIPDVNNSYAKIDFDHSDSSSSSSKNMNI